MKKKVTFITYGAAYLFAGGSKPLGARPTVGAASSFLVAESAGLAPLVQDANLKVLTIRETVTEDCCMCLVRGAVMGESWH